MKKSTASGSAAARLRIRRAKAITAAVVAASIALLCAGHAGAAAPPAQEPDALIPSPERQALRFGEAIAARGDLILAGSPVDGDLGAGEGSAHVMRVALQASDPHGQAWECVQVARLGSGSAGDHFGCAVAVSRGAAPPWMAIGADRAWIRAGFEGAVYLFEGLDAGVPRGRLAAPLPQPGAEFGCCVAFDGAAQFVAIGARREDVAGFTDAGSVHLFTAVALPADEGGIAAAARVPWRCVQSIAPPRPTPSQWFGSAVAVGERWLAVGAPGASAVGLHGAGCVELFRRTAHGVFEHAFTLASPTAANHAWFGSALAIDGAALIVGEPRAERDGVRCGAAWIYDLDEPGAAPRALQPAQRLSPALGGLGFGSSVAIDARFAIVGAPGADTADGIEDCGGGFVFARESIASAPALALRSATLTPMLLSGSTATIACIDHPGAEGGLSVALLGHLFVEEESTAPNPGVALYALTPADAARTTSRACASSP